MQHSRLRNQELTNSQSAVRRHLFCRIAEQLFILVPEIQRYVHVSKFVHPTPHPAGRMTPYLIPRSPQSEEGQHHRKPTSRAADHDSN